jgi:hypothetical protein
MVQNIMSVDIRAFADLLHKHTRPSADAICDSLILHEDKLGEHKDDLQIIGGYLDRLQSCLKNFCATIDVLFRLRTALRDGLKAMLERVLSLATSFHMGPLDCSTPTLYHYFASRFQHAFAQGYGLVRSGHVRDAAALLIVLERFPDLGHLSTLTMELYSIRSTSRSPDCLPGASTARSSDDAAERPGKKKGKSTSELPRQAALSTPLAVALPSKAPDAKPKLLCGYFNSAEGCNKPPKECRHAHRLPTSDADREYLSSFFSRNPRRHPK